MDTVGTLKRYNFPLQLLPKEVVGGMTGTHVVIEKNVVTLQIYYTENRKRKSVKYVNSKGLWERATEGEGK